MTMAFVSSLPLAQTARAVPRTAVRRRTRLAACAAQPAPPLQNQTTVQVNRDTGRRVKSVGINSVTVTNAEVELPTGDVSDLDLVTTRAAQAAVFALTSAVPSSDSSTTASWLENARVVVFAHGFSQRPANYVSTLRRLALLGYVVLAPRVWLLDVAWPWVSVETASNSPFDAPGKLQTALLIDIARCGQLARRCGARETHVLGHSMGGAMTLAYMPYARGQVASAAVLAPAVAASAQTSLNPYAHGTDSANFTALAEAMPSVPLLLLQGSADKIVSPADTAAIAQALKHRVGALTGLGMLEGGTHIGFEDRLNIDIDIPVLDVVLAVLFLLIDLLVFGPGDVLDLDTREQLETTKDLLQAWFAAAGNMPNRAVIDKVDTTPVLQQVNLSWSTEDFPVEMSISD